MPYFSTTYYAGGRPFGSTIYARDVAEARMFATMRNIGERLNDDASMVRPPLELSIGEIVARTPYQADYMDADDVAAALHAACWLGFLALSSGVATPREILGDLGLVHRLAHHATGDLHEPAKRRAEIVELARDIETRIPGWPAAEELPPAQPRGGWLERMRHIARRLPPLKVAGRQ